MKTVVITILVFFSTILAFGQQENETAIMESVNQNQYIAAITPLIAVGLLVILTLVLTKYILDYWLKSKIIEKGISEHLAVSVLRRNTNDKKEDAAKWVFFFSGIGVGLTITYYTMPLHIHSVAIVAFSLAGSYLGYLFYLKGRKE